MKRFTYYVSDYALLAEVARYLNVGATGYMDLSAHIAFFQAMGASVAIEFMVRPTHEHTDGQTSVLFSISDGTVNKEFTLFYGQYNTRSGEVFTVSRGFSSKAFIDTVNSYANKWTKVRIETGAPNLKMFINDAEVALDGPTISDNWTAFAGLTAAHIGKRSINNTYGRSAAVDSIKFYNIAGAAPVLLLAYEFNEGTANDTSGNNKHGVLAGDAAIIDY